MYEDYVAYPKRAASFGRPLASFLALSALWCLLLLLFNRFPQIDLSVAGSVFTNGPCASADPVGDVCGMFGYDRDRLFVNLRSITLVLPYIAVVVLLAVIYLSWRKLGPHWRTPKVNQCVAALLSLALGCGVIVNLILKAFSGRPRPRDTDLFGGVFNFVEAGSFAGQCLKNCSFISGESSSAGWLLCLVLLLPPRWRLPLGVPLAVASIIMPTMRVLTGAHYLSDAVLGWLLSLVIFAAMLTVFEIFGPRSQRP
ncbi:phosphatase PAP2 family protein [Rhizobium sp. LEGMi198b]|uniref:phosphatase PAP2 family protein n=1 Tax=unclassified Rhizobium TaxID=2613769 RepID=UPI000CDF4937|nr:MULTISPECIES: phosphatase PAP2 family protein [Rhizobium]AVA22519.1 phosphatidic acid phosphatase protein [Rhizobium sp. NXC24]MDK4738469.1 phosphatase PAP2 family protein [Rhizobium sp. CNPSo 3464]UWU19907.1 phosphatase PAP2 family protein [Rhizobium tropici]